MWKQNIMYQAWGLIWSHASTVGGYSIWKTSSYDKKLHICRTASLIDVLNFRWDSILEKCADSSVGAIYKKPLLDFPISHMKVSVLLKVDDFIWKQ